MVCALQPFSKKSEYTADKFSLTEAAVKRHAKYLSMETKR